MDYWEILGIAPSSDPDFIKKAYRMQLLALTAVEGENKGRLRLEQAYAKALDYSRLHGGAKRKTHKNSIHRITRKRNNPTTLSAAASPDITKKPRNAGKQQHRIKNLTRKKSTRKQRLNNQQSTDENKVLATIKQLLRELM